MTRLLLYQNKTSSVLCNFLMEKESDFALDDLLQQGDVYVDCDEDAWLIKSDCDTKLHFQTITQNVLEEGDLLPVVTVDQNGVVLMIAFTNKFALEQTFLSGFACYFSRSRNQFWKKGDTSGHTQQILEVKFEKTKKLLLFKVIQNKAACHTGYYSCFYRKRDINKDTVIFSQKLIDPEEQS